MSEIDDLLEQDYAQQQQTREQEALEQETLEQQRRLRDEAATERPLVTAEDVMTLEQARALSGRRGARVVLLMGEPATGKTALTAMLWQQFLEQDGVAGHRLAGSRSVRGFERRAHWARQQAGQPQAHFPPTRAEQDGVLHLRVRRPDGRRVELLLSDLAGAQFERVREGKPLLDELPWAARADRFAVVLDAHALSSPGESEIAVTRARRLLLALAASHVVRDSARVALVVTKSDTLNETGAAALARHEPDLLEVARHCDPEAICVRTAAVAVARAERQGLAELISWLCLNDRPRIMPAVPEVAPGRSIAAFRA
jgi:hypothetical protein